MPTSLDPSYTKTTVREKQRIEGMAYQFAAKCKSGEILEFSSSFESGNLDRVVMVSPIEYDLYMRPDSNSRGHHQWFYFKVVNRSAMGRVRFNILNFTKQESLYQVGMKLCYCS